MPCLISCIILATLCGTVCLADPPNRRKNIEALTAEELLCYREHLQAAIDNGTFYTTAEWHAKPLMSAPELVGYSCHGTPLFLLWYRFFLSAMEKVIGCPIPYWDFTSETLPTAFTDTYYKARNGTSVLNPLKSVVMPVDVQKSEDVWPNTYRSEESPFPGVEIKEKEDYALYACNDFKNFSAALEDCRNLVLTSLAGTIPKMALSAYDPLFWSLHMNVDRLFFQWQLMHDRYIYPPDVTEAPIELSSYTVPASDLIPYFDGWLQGAPGGEAERWKKSLKTALGRLNEAPNTTSGPASPATTAPVPRTNLIVAHREGKPFEADSPVIIPATRVANAPAPMEALSMPEEDPDLMQPESIQHVECPFPVAEIGTSQPCEHMIVTLKEVAPTPIPYELVTILDGKIVGRTGLPGMGPAYKTICTMDRHVDISRAYEKLGYKANGTTPAELLECMSFQLRQVDMPVGRPYTPIGVSIDAKVFLRPV